MMHVLEILSTNKNFILKNKVQLYKIYKKI